MLGGCYIFACVLMIACLACVCESANNYTRPCDITAYGSLNVSDGSSGFYVAKDDHRDELDLYMDSATSLEFHYSIFCPKKCLNFTIRLIIPDGFVQITSPTEFHVSCYNSILAEKIIIPKAFPSVSPPTFLLKGKIPVDISSDIIGRTSLDFELIKKDDVLNIDDGILQPIPITLENNVTSGVNITSRKTFAVAVIRKLRPVDRIFRLVLYCVQIFVMIGFGAKLDLGIVKENLWRPVAPAIGLSCQYIVMPLIAYTVAKTVPIDNDAVSLGIFIAGICPGGGGSNMYSYLLKGDLSLSITMTAVSTIVALGMIPLWVYTLGQTFDFGAGLSIPFTSVAVSLSILIVPLVFGVFLRQKFPKAADRVQKLLKPITVVFSFILLVIGIYSNLFIFRLFRPNIILAALLLPYVGYFIGGVVAAIFRQDWKRIKTIGIETGMQNTGIGYILLINSFPAPDGDIAAVGPVASAVMTPIPPFLTTIVYLTYQHFKKKYSPVSKDEKSDEKEKQEEVLPSSEKLTPV